MIDAIIKLLGQQAVSELTTRLTKDAALRSMDTLMSKLDTEEGLILATSSLKFLNSNPDLIGAPPKVTQYVTATIHSVLTNKYQREYGVVTSADANDSGPFSTSVDRSIAPPISLVSSNSEKYQPQREEIDDEEVLGIQ